MNNFTKYAAGRLNVNAKEGKERNGNKGGKKGKGGRREMRRKTGMKRRKGVWDEGMQ